jgi:hypothetical protein
MERCATHWFGTYWAAHRGKVAGEAEKLIGLRRASVVPITHADSFFQELAEKITALEDFALTDPVSTKVAVTRMKRYLGSPEQRINLHDLVNAETERVHAAINGARFNPDDRNISPEITLARLRAYEAEMSVLLPMLACGGSSDLRSEKTDTGPRSRSGNRSHPFGCLNRMPRSNFYLVASVSSRR